jgi:hypothetical protein
MFGTSIKIGYKNIKIHLIIEENLFQNLKEINFTFISGKLPSEIFFKVFGDGIATKVKQWATTFFLGHL